MKRLLAGITTSLLLAAPTLQAQELTETLPMAYFNLPLVVHSRHQNPSTASA